MEVLAEFSVEALRATENVLEGDRAHGEADELAEGDRHDGEIVGPQAQGRNTQNERDHESNDDAHDDGQPQAEVKGEDDDAHRVRARGDERHLTEVQQPGVPELDVEADGCQAVDDRLNTNSLCEGLGEDETPIHVSPPARVCRGCPAGESSG